MDLALVMDKLRPGENVAPDLSSYAAMVSKWRGSGNAPTLADCQAKWDEIKADIAAAITRHNTEDARADMLTKAGVTPQTFMWAILKKLYDNDSTGLQAIKSVYDAIKARYP